MQQWETTLDLPGSASRSTIIRGLVFCSIILAGAVLVAFFGKAELAVYPPFATFHAGFIFFADTMTAYLLFGQFTYRRRLSYLVLGGAFLFSSLTMIPFLLSFPGALVLDKPVIGGPQSSIWIWHFWHLIFPAIIGLALLLQLRRERPVPVSRARQAIAIASTAVLLLVFLEVITVTVFHERLPVLIIGNRVPYGPNFFVTSTVVIAVTALAFMLALRLASRATVIHIWIAVLLLALLADETASAAAFPRYSLGWYLGRVDSMFATSALLVVFVSDINRLYRQLAGTMTELFEANKRLSGMIEEKDGLLAELRESEERIRRMAYRDAVTNLPNRRSMMETLHPTLAQAKRHGHTTALLFLDLDRFKEVNDRLGHDAGDALLKEVGSRLLACLRAGDTAARLGGDEFVILLPEISDAGDAESVAQKVLHMMQRPVAFDGYSLQVSLSIGVAISAKGREVTPEELIREADAAMYVAKNSGRNRYFIGEPRPH